MLAGLEFGLWGLAAFAMSVILAMIVLLWGQAVGQEKELEEQEEELEEHVDRVMDLQSRVLELEDEADQLRAQGDAPSLNLGNLLHALDVQADVLGTVTKHRALRERGLGEYPVTAVQRTPDDHLVVRAHADVPVAQVIGEEAALVHKSSDAAIAIGSVRQAGEQMVEIGIGFFELQDAVQEDIMERRVGAEDFVLRLAWLHFPPYNQLTDDELHDLSDSLRGAGRSISQCLQAPEEQPQLEAANE